jgi:hypothetical protein
MAVVILVSYLERLCHRTRVSARYQDMGKHALNSQKYSVGGTTVSSILKLNSLETNHLRHRSFWLWQVSCRCDAVIIPIASAL